MLEDEYVMPVATLLVLGGLWAFYVITKSAVKNGILEAIKHADAAKVFRRDAGLDDGTTEPGQGPDKN